MANTLTTNEGEVRERLTREYMPENDPPLDTPIAGITPAMIEAGATMAAEVFRGKVTEGNARLWVGEIYAAMLAARPQADDPVTPEMIAAAHTAAAAAEQLPYAEIISAIYRAMRAAAPR